MPEPQNKPSLKEDLLLVAELAWSIGWIVAVPAVLFGLGGAYLDRSFGTSPLFILIGMALAMGSSGVGLYKKLRQILGRR
jgi:hypothetical protein